MDIGVVLTCLKGETILLPVLGKQTGVSYHLIPTIQERTNVHVICMYVHTYMCTL